MEAEQQGIVGMFRTQLNIASIYPAKSNIGVGYGQRWPSGEHRWHARA